ncbi:hypothetical protein BHE74_00011833 [Ensete ventricosum]|nr:hypothetical protein BHE74_00011833 [Ensete ventricosum]
MKLATNVRGRDPLSLGVGVLIGCFLISLTYVTMYKSDMLSSSSCKLSAFTLSIFCENMARSRSSSSWFRFVLQWLPRSHGRRTQLPRGIRSKALVVLDNQVRATKSLIPVCVHDKFLIFAGVCTAHPDNKKEGTGRPCDPKSGPCQVVNGPPPTLVDRLLQTPVSSDSKKPGTELSSHVG